MSDLILRQNLLGGMIAYLQEEMTEEALKRIAEDRELYTEFCVMFGKINEKLRKDL